MRVYELAKKLGMENRDLIPELKRLGIAVASHSSALDDDAVRMALEKLEPKNKARHDESPGSHETMIHPQESRKVMKAGKEVGAPHETSGRMHAAHADESHKPDKKRILIKKKKDELADESAPMAAGEPSQSIGPWAQSMAPPAQASPVAATDAEEQVHHESISSSEAGPAVGSAPSVLTTESGETKVAAPVAPKPRPSIPWPRSARRRVFPSKTWIQRGATNSKKPAKDLDPAKKKMYVSGMMRLAGMICGLFLFNGVKSGPSTPTIVHRLKLRSRERKA